MTQDEPSRTALLYHHARKVYHLVIEMLFEKIESWMTIASTLMNSRTPETDNTEYWNICNVVLLMTITYNNLGCLYFELGMVLSGCECMTKLSEFSYHHNNFYEVFQFGCFENVIEEVKLNLLFCKFHVPSHTAKAA
jgi:hypothetical protein